MRLEEAKEILNRNGYLIEDWKDDVREFKKSKNVSYKNDATLDNLNFEIKGKKGEKFYISIHPSDMFWEKDIVKVEFEMDDHYLFSKELKVSELKDYFESDELNKKLWSELKYYYKHAFDYSDDLGIDEYKSKLKDMEKLIDDIQSDICIEFDESDILKKLKKYNTYKTAYENRKRKWFNNRDKAYKSIDELPLRVGDYVQTKVFSGWNPTKLDPEKEYQIVSIDGKYAHIKPVNGRGKEHTIGLEKLRKSNTTVRDYLNSVDDDE